MASRTLFLFVCTPILATALLAACSSGPATQPDAVAPPAALSLNVFPAIQTNAVYFSWRSLRNTTNYRVEAAAAAEGPFSLLAHTVNNYYTHTGLAPGATNYYKVIAEGPGGLSVGNTVYQGYSAASAPSSIQTVLYTNEGLIYSYDPETETKPADELVILTLNMHTYQEDNQEQKFDLIVQLIADMDVDFIVFQENAQHKESPLVYGAIREDNMCAIITNRLKQNHGLDYYFAWDWAHYGWNVWEEGIAVMSKYPLVESESRWVSSSASTGSIISRKAIHGRFIVPHMDNLTVNLISTHLHWRTSLTDTEQNKQVQKVRDMADEKHQEGALTLVGGDFNAPPTREVPVWNEGYLSMVSNAAYVDTFLAFHPRANHLPQDPAYSTIGDGTVGGNDPGRIDYIFMRSNPAFGIVSSQIIFTPGIAGVVSDHFGVITRLRKAE